MQYMKRIEIFQVSKAQQDCLKTQSVRELIQSRKLSEELESFIDQIACLKNWLFREPFQSRKWIDIVHNFKAQTACLKN